MSLPTPKSLQIKANGVDVSSSIDWSSLDVTLVLTKEVSTFKFDVKLYGSKYAPVVGDLIDLYETTTLSGVDTTAHIFGGSITEIETTAAGLLKTAQITCTDWSYTMDGKLVVKSYASMDPADIIADIVSNYCPAGFNATTYVQRYGYNIPSIKFNYKQPTKCIQSLASQIGYEWYVDADKNIHFFLAESSAAPFNIDDTSGALEWPTLNVDVNLQNMKNSVFVIGGVYHKEFTHSNAVDTYLTNGTQKAWGIAYAYTSATISIKLDGVVQSIGIANQVTDPSLYDVLYDAANRTITFYSVPTTAKTIEVLGIAEIPIIGHAIDQNAIATYGEFQDVIFDSQIKSIVEAQMRAKAEIELFGHAVYNVKFKTTTPTLRVGQQITFNSTQYGVNTTLVVKRIEGRGRTPKALEYTVECVGSDTVSFVDIMTTLLLQQQSSTQIDNTTLEVLLGTMETLVVADAAPALSHTTNSYVYGPSGGQVGVFNLSSWG